MFYLINSHALALNYIVLLHGKKINFHFFFSTVACFSIIILSSYSSIFRLTLVFFASSTTKKRRKNFSFTITINFPTDLSTVYIKTSNRFISFILISLLVWNFFTQDEIGNGIVDDFCLLKKGRKNDENFKGQCEDFFRFDFWFGVVWAFWWVYWKFCGDCWNCFD